MNENAFRNLSYGVYIVSSWDGERPAGCTANCAMQITAEPSTIAISMNHQNFTHKCIKESGRFAISILSEKSDPAIIGTFGFQSGEKVNKFDSTPYEIKDGMPVLADACAYITCEVINEMETDTHTVFLGKVTDADQLKSQTPMTYSYYHNVIKGKAPKSAPTYLPEAETQKEAEEAYVCKICGYVYDGEVPFEELPEDYLCPLCKQPKSVFEKKKRA